MNSKPLTLDDLKQAREVVEKSVAGILGKLEEKFGEGIITGLQITRWNGSNEFSGPISKISIGIRIP